MMADKDRDNIAEDAVKEIVEKEKQPQRDKQWKQSDQTAEKGRAYFLHHAMDYSIEKFVVENEFSGYLFEATWDLLSAIAYVLARMGISFP